MTATTARKPRLSRDAWLQHALEVLRAEGISGVRVERLARDLKVTKGSFYWHFEDRSDLLENILEYWDGRYTDVALQNRELTDVEPALGLLRLIARSRWLFKIAADGTTGDAEG